MGGRGDSLFVSFGRFGFLLCNQSFCLCVYPHHCHMHTFSHIHTLVQLISVAAPESYSLVLEHSLAPSVKFPGAFASSNQHVLGEMNHPNGTSVLQFPVRTDSDIIPLHVFLLLSFFFESVSPRDAMIMTSRAHWFCQTCPCHEWRSHLLARPCFRMFTIACPRTSTNDAPSPRICWTWPRCNSTTHPTLTLQSERPRHRFVIRASCCTCMSTMPTSTRIMVASVRPSHAHG